MVKSKDEIIKAFEKHTEVDDGYFNEFHLANVLLVKGKYKEAIRLLKKASRKYKKPEEKAFYYGIISSLYQHVGNVDIEKALKYSYMSEKADPKSCQAKLGTAYTLLYSKNDTKLARKKLVELFAMESPKKDVAIMHPAYQLMGEACFLEQDFYRAAVYLEKSIIDHPGLGLRLVNLLVDAEKYPDQCYEYLIKAKGTAEKSRNRDLLSKVDDLLEKLKGWWDLDDKELYIHEVEKKVARLLFGYRNSKKALSVLRKEIKINPYPEFKALEVTILEMSKKYTEAIKVAEKYTKNAHSTFEKANIFACLHLLHKRQNNAVEARKYSNKTIDVYKRIIKNTKSKDWEVNRAMLNLISEYRIAGKLEKALSVAKVMEWKLNKTAKDKRSLLPIFEELKSI